MEILRRDLNMGLYQTHIQETKKRISIRKEKKKLKNVVQYLIEQWIQGNLNRHQPSNKSKYSEIMKIDREIPKIYGLADEVQPTDKKIPTQLIYGDGYYNPFMRNRNIYYNGKQQSNPAPNKKKRSSGSQFNMVKFWNESTNNRGRYHQTTM